MSGPKHLWSGDWESESDRNAAERAQRPAPAPEAPVAFAAGPESRQRRRFSARQLAAAIVGLLVVAGVAAAIVAGSGGSGGPSKPPARTHNHTSGATTPPGLPGSSGGVTPTQSTPAQSSPTPVISGPNAEWLGMQIVTSPAGAVVDTVRAGSAGDIAGFEPGDVITAIDDQQIDTVRDLRRATINVPLGHQLKIMISRGSSTLTAAVTLKVRPTIRP